VFRPLRETVAGSERKANSEEEDNDQEVYVKPVLQRVIQLRGSVRTDTGTRRRQNVWNSVPSTVNFSSLNCSKQSIGSVDFSVLFLIVRLLF